MFSLTASCHSRCPVHAKVLCELGVGLLSLVATPGTIDCAAPGKEGAALAVC